MNGLLKEKRLGLTLFSVFWFLGAVFLQTNLDYYLKAARENNPTIKENLA